MLEMKVIDEIAPTNGSFSCFERTFGYYAEVKKDCKQFHLCYPEKEENEEKLIYHRITFTCDAGQVFDQRELVCVKPSNETTPCEESPKYYQELSDQVADVLLKSAPQYFQEVKENGKRKVKRRRKIKKTVN
ncbi:uncharacterized protein B4U80_02249 [Leptotrombidium deliense]|uniref:Chitin-binding type-2 domain-containing protein n=1 Tax=Leptotrombidium deliense TaxID=299467 RepID=A0A443RWX5_9ACAR|nr:uncharacterized protein B4U80_02249 [Leptotrombidium deliense]